MSFGSYAHIGESLMRLSSPKSKQKIAPFRSKNFVNKGFFGVQGTKRSKSCRIYEYFNKATAENTCFKI